MAQSMRDGVRPVRELPLQMEQMDSLDQSPSRWPKWWNVRLPPDYP